MQSLTILLIQVLLGFIGYYIAIKKNKSPIIWFIVGFLFGFIGIIILLILSDKVDNSNDLSYENKYSPRNKQNKEYIEEATVQQEETQPSNFWFFLNENKQITGPVSLDIIYKNIIKKEYPEKTWIWKKGMKNWQRLEEIPEALEQLKNIK